MFTPRAHCDNGPRGTIRVRVGDDISAVSSAPVVQAASAHVYGGSDTYASDAAVAVPIAQGQSYVVEPEWTTGTPVARLFWFPLG
jgi:hypothetical protein